MEGHSASISGDVPERALPLSGIRVLDLGMVWAGPQAAALLGDLGADVVKVEGPDHPDPFRAMFGAADPASFPQDELLEWSPLFIGLNRNKRGIALDLRSEQDREVIRELARAADAVLDNFSTRVLPRFGLAYPRLRADNPRLITCSMSGFGRTGPLCEAITYGPMVEQLSGSLALSGYPNIGPVGLASAFDAIAGCYSALGIVAALLRRERTGAAADIDFAQTEVGPAVMGSFIADRQLGRAAYIRDGNADPEHAPHRCYRCAGDDRWVAIAVRSDDEFAALARCAGHAEWTTDPRFAAVAARKQHEHELDALVGAWTATQAPDDIAESLQRAGVVAAPLRSVREAMTEPRLRDAGAFVTVDRHPNGAHEYQAPIPVIDGVRLPVRRPAPRLGEHTAEILRDWATRQRSELAGGSRGTQLPATRATAPPLDGVAVLVTGRSDACAMAGRVLCDLGAAVWHDADTTGAVQRRTPGARAFLGAGIRSDPRADDLHIVIGDGAVQDPSGGASVVVAIDDVSGGWRLDDLTACMLSSLGWRIGDPGHEPLQPGRGYASAVAGSLAALSAVALLLHDLRSAPPATAHRVRISLLECALMIGTFDTSVVSFGGEPPPRNRRPWPTICFPCRDGWVGLFPRTEEMWQSLCVMTDRVELINDPRMETFVGRQKHTQVILDEMAPWFAAHTTVEADEAARSLRVPLAIVLDPLDVIDLPQQRARWMYLPVMTQTGERVMVPGLPFLLDGVRLGGGTAAGAPPPPVATVSARG
jgi:crotonobetainyl-CoA:carnitine CoA-transferase CaiB-like acyl-CoA transferase